MAILIKSKLFQSWKKTFCEVTNFTFTLVKLAPLYSLTQLDIFSILKNNLILKKKSYLGPPLGSAVNSTFSCPVMSDDPLKKKNLVLHLKSTELPNHQNETAGPVCPSGHDHVLKKFFYLFFLTPVKGLRQSPTGSTRWGMGNKAIKVTKIGEIHGHVLE